MSKQKYIPGSDVDSEEIFKFPFTEDAQTIMFIRDHGQIMFIIRGPPGTGKDSLTKMVLERYPTSVECSADFYFRDTFSSSKRDPESLKKSHEFCHKKVKRYCQSSKHPVVIKNTHMKKFELQKYLDFAAEFNYTVIMAATIHAIEITPDILAKSNTKGLNADYFHRRLQQWEEVIPVLTGWFLSPKDSLSLLSHLQDSLQCLLSDGKFCRVLNVFNKDELLSHFKARRLLYCIAACGEETRCNEIKSHYLSEHVKQFYGKSFTISIQGYIVTTSSVFAVVHLNQTMKSLRYLRYTKLNSNSKLEMDILASFTSLSLGNNLEKYSATVNFNDLNLDEVKKPVGEPGIGVIDISCCSFIQLAQAKGHVAPAKLAPIFFKLLAEAADETGIINFSQFRKLDESFEICRLSDGWYIRPPTKLSFRTIYTGLYV